MFKLSKNHFVKQADEEKAEDKEPELSGAEVDEADDDIAEELEEEGAAGEDGKDAEEELEDAKSPKFDARREAATPHAHAAKDLFAKRRELMNQVNMLDDQLAKHREVLQALDPKMKHEAYADDKELKHYLKPEKLMDDKKKKKKKKLDKKSEAEVFDGLLKVAEVLDYAGDTEGVSLVESVLQIFAKKDDGMPKYDVQTVEKTERKYPEAAAVPPTMSTRNCPDHYGAQMKRVAEGTFQCELDGRMYNWNEGFKDYNGNTYPAAPIRSVDFPDTTERMFETREMATNKKVK
jgi:hypothetical protein